MNLSVEADRMRSMLSALTAGAVALVMGSLVAAPADVPLSGREANVELADDQLRAAVDHTVTKVR